MDLIIHFNRKSLSEIKKYFKKLTKDNLNFIELVDFCGAIIKKLSNENTNNLYLYELLSTKEGKLHLLRIICSIFYAVDVDFRCAITWHDFSAYCLRLIRNQFTANNRLSALNYKQYDSNGPLINAVRMYYCNVNSKLYLFDKETPIIRIITKNRNYDGNKFNPCIGILRYLNMYCLENTNKKQKGTNIQINNIWKNKMPIIDKGTVLFMLYISRTNQFIISTSDNFLSYWDLGLNRLIGFERMEKSQVGVCYCIKTEMLLTWGNSGSDSSFNVINPVHRITKYKVKIHKEYVLDACELPLHQLIVSCSIDRTVCLWPIKFIKIRAFSTAKIDDKYDIAATTQYTDAEIADQCIYLKGNFFNIIILIL